MLNTGVITELNIAGLFEMKYINTGLAAAAVIELLLLVIILNLYISVRRREKKDKDRESGAILYDSMVCSGTDEAHMLLRKSDMAPLFFSGNFEKVTGISTDRFEEDMDSIRLLMETEDFRKLKSKYRSWNGQDAFHADFRRKSSAAEWMRLVIIQSEDGANELYIFRNITDEKREAMKLTDELERAEEESRSKTTFLSRMSHEIRTPINGIIGMMTLAHKQVEPGSQIDTYLVKAEDLSEHLVALVNDILDMSRIEAGKIELENKPFDIRTLADKLRNMFLGNTQNKGLSYTVELVDFTEPVLVGDEFRLSQVLVNFLSNAVKFTAEGEIRVTFKQMLIENNVSDIMIRVHDTGIGMAPEFMNRIFKPFEQENASISHSYGGTGLGMAITDQIVRLMGGEIVIDSMPGKGSDFTVYLHMPVAGEMQKQSMTVDVQENDNGTDDYTFAGKHVLLAEDNEINAEIACEILADAGAVVDAVVNGQKAVQKVAEHSPDYYDFVLMDIQMPVMDGREAARQIRQLEEKLEKNPGKAPERLLIFALSADAFYEDEKLSMDAGMDGHFAKPVNFEEVRKKIGQTVRGRRGGRR